MGTISDSPTGLAAGAGSVGVRRVRPTSGPRASAAAAGAPPPRGVQGRDGPARTGGGRHGRELQPCWGACEECEAAHQGVRGVPEERRQMDAPAHVPGVWARGLLRLVEWPARAGALSRDKAPAHAVRRARGEVALVLCGWGVFVSSRQIPPQFFSRPPPA